LQYILVNVLENLLKSQTQKFYDNKMIHIKNLLLILFRSMIDQYIETNRKILSTYRDVLKTGTGPNKSFELPKKNRFCYSTNLRSCIISLYCFQKLNLANCFEQPVVSFIWCSFNLFTN